MDAMSQAFDTEPECRAKLSQIQSRLQLDVPLTYELRLGSSSLALARSVGLSRTPPIVQVC
jgi:hypothetical protein